MGVGSPVLKGIRVVVLVVGAGVCGIECRDLDMYHIMVCVSLRVDKEVGDGGSDN